MSILHIQRLNKVIVIQQLVAHAVNITTLPFLAPCLIQSEDFIALSSSSANINLMIASLTNAFELLNAGF